MERGEREVRGGRNDRSRIERQRMEKYEVGEKGGGKREAGQREKKRERYTTKDPLVWVRSKGPEEQR